MDELSCKVCFCDYGEELFPKILNCGHSLCSECLANISNCPLCRADIAEEDKAEIPTSFDLLSLIEMVRETQITKEEFCQKHVDPLREQILERKQQASDLLKQFSDNEKKLKKELKDIVDDLATLYAIEDIPEDLNVADSLKRVNCLKKKFLSRTSNFMNCSKKLPEPSFRRKNFENQMDFLYEIYKRIRKGEDLYMTAQVEGKIKFGAVEIYTRNLFFHSLSTIGNEIKTNATVVLFDDVKSCMISDKFQTFLKLNCNERGLEELMIIQLTEHSLVPQFVKICTGECGPSYKGSSYERIKLLLRNIHQNPLSALSVPSYIHDDIEERGQIDYTVDDPRSINYIKCELVVYFQKAFELGFTIFELPAQRNFNNIIGKIITPCDGFINNLPHEQKNHMVINECGIVLPLEY